MRNVNRTVCKMKLHTALMPENMGPRAKLQRMTIVTLTRLLMMSIVASSRSGISSRRNTRLPDDVVFSSSHCADDREKNDISLPETNPEIARANNASARAAI